MAERIGGFALWALVPDMIGEVAARGSIDALVPAALRGLFGLAGGAAAVPAPDPIRDGATVIIPVSGVLSPRGRYGSSGDTDRLTQRMLEFGDDPRVGAIVLDMATPGGLVYGTQEAADAIYQVRQVKPVVAVASNWMVASAGYWLASQATAFYASPSSDVGSVGVYAGHTDMSGFEEKIGMKTTLIASDPQKIEGNEHEPLGEEARADIQAAVDENNAAFVAAIARGRKMAAADVPKVHGKGRLYSARRAAEAGAIDGIMTLREVVAKIGAPRARLELMRRQAALLESVAAI